MNAPKASWWYLLGVFVCPLVVLVALLEGYMLLRLDLNLNLDLRAWIWISLVASLAAGIGFLLRLPLRLGVRVYIGIWYVLIFGFYLLMAANRFAASLA